MTLSSGEPSAVGGRHRVVIIGSGFGGLNAAKALKRADVDITLISKTTTHLFQPLLYQVATGILSEGDIAPTTRLILRRQKNVRVLLGEVNAIDLKAQTVTSKLMDMTTVTPYDSLIVAAGAQQSYFGNDEFATFAPGMKTIDDALELRGRILGAFEAAEVSTDHAERERRLTFVVVGAGPTGVEVAGQIVELAERTLAGAFRTITPSECRVILLDAAPAVLPPMGPKLGLKAQRRLEKMDVEVQLNAMVTAVDYKGITIKEKDGGERRIECACKVWAAGVAASPLGKMIAEGSDGTEIDRAGRVIVEPDLTVKGHPNVFVVGDLMFVPGVPGVRQVAAMFPGATPMYMTGSSDGSYAGLAAAGLAGTGLAGLAARGGSAPTPAAAAPAGAGGAGPAATRPAAQQTPAVPAAAAGSAIPGLPPGLPPGVVANLAATLAAIPGATIIVVPPSPNANQ